MWCNLEKVDFFCLARGVLLDNGVSSPWSAMIGKLTHLQLHNKQRHVKREVRTLWPLAKFAKVDATKLQASIPHKQTTTSWGYDVDKYSRTCIKQYCLIQYLHPVTMLKWPSVWPCLIQYRPPGPNNIVLDKFYCILKLHTWGDGHFGSDMSSDGSEGLWPSRVFSQARFHIWQCPSVKWVGTSDREWIFLGIIYNRSRSWLVFASPTGWLHVHIQYSGFPLIKLAYIL